MTDQEDSLSKIELLESAPQFSFLEFDEKKWLVSFMNAEKYLAGDTLIREGQTHGKVFFIYRGAVEIVKSSAEGNRVILARLGAGEILGESAILPQPTESTVVVRATGETLTLTLPREGFDAMKNTHPETAFKIMADIIRLLRRRLNEVSNKLADHLGDEG